MRIRTLLFFLSAALLASIPAWAAEHAKLTGVLYSNSCLLSSPVEGKICFALIQPFRGKVGIFEEHESGAKLLRSKRTNEQGVFQARLAPGRYRIELLPLRGKRAITSANYIEVSDSSEIRLGFRVERVSQ